MTTPADRYRRAYEEERKRKVEAEAQVRTEREAQLRLWEAERAALAVLEKQVRERLLLVKGIDRRIRVEQKAATARSPRQQIARAGSATALVFSFEAPRGGPVRVHAALKGKDHTEAKIQGAPSEITEARLDDVIEAWVRQVARL